MMRNCLILIFFIFISSPAHAQDIKTAKVVYHNFQQTLSGWGYITPLGEGKAGLKIKIYRRAAGLSSNMPARIILGNKEIPAYVGSVYCKENITYCDILPVKKNPLPVFQFAKGVVVLKVYKSLAVPNSAIVDKEGKKFVIIKEDAGFAQLEKAHPFRKSVSNGAEGHSSLTGFTKKHIKTGLNDNNFTEVISGLKLGEEIVTKGSYEIFHQDIKKEYKVGD